MGYGASGEEGSPQLDLLDSAWCGAGLVIFYKWRIFVFTLVFDLHADRRVGVYAMAEQCNYWRWIIKKIMSRFKVHPDISKAETISTEVYLSREIFELAKEKIFAPSWQLIGDVDLLSEHGGAYPDTLFPHFLDEPLVLTRDLQNNLHCLSNVCTHRGNLLVEKPCSVHHLQCR